MTKFNPSILSSPLEYAELEWGVPGCLMDLTRDIISLLPSDLLGTYQSSVAEGRESARCWMATKTKEFFGDSGFLTYNTTTGKLEFFSPTSKASTLAGLDTLGYYAGIGQAAWQAVEGALDQIEEISNCIDSVKQYFDDLNDTNKPTGNATVAPPVFPSAAVAAGFSESYNRTVDFDNRASAVINDIKDELDLRRRDPSREPVLITDPTDPDTSGVVETPAIFRLVYGPPKSKSGQFLLSIDGIYYNSQTSSYSMGDVPTAADIGMVPSPEKWKMEHPANLGGKGDGFSLKQINRYVGTLFDIDIIDDSTAMETYYSSDNMLRTLIGQKNVAVNKLRDDRLEYIASGYSEDSAIVSNLNNQVYSVVSEFDYKISKRKKQIEVAVKAPDFFGIGQVFTPGHIPINDFTYLSSLNLPVEVARQRNLTFDHGEVEDIILPLVPRFVKAKDSEWRVTLTPLEIAEVGTGDIIDVNDTSANAAPVLRVTEGIVKDDTLEASYSFLIPSVETNGKSGTFRALNDDDDGGYHDAQLVGNNVSSVFASGVSIPKLDGIVRYKYNINGNTSSVDFDKLGSYVRLPDSPKMQNLMYNSKGCSFDFWIHMPNLGAASNFAEQDPAVVPNFAASDSSWTDYNYYKIILANENIGGSYQEDDITLMTDNFGTTSVRGMLMGFTRDPQITQNSIVGRGSDFDIGDTLGVTTADTVNTTHFFIAPTQSANGTDVDFIRKGDCNVQGDEYRAMSVSISSTVGIGNNTVALSDASETFVHVSVSFDVTNDEVCIRLNGKDLATSSYSELFGTQPGFPAKIPTFISPEDSQNPSYSYSNISKGPKTNTYFTPWIIGGGYTDGIAVNLTGSNTGSGGFMATSHGLYSGLTGHVGSFKIYSRPLDTTEALKNYEAHKGYYEDIRT
jgi:hypothetical protein